jgi:multiple sugar transport system substrate-binding protein
VLGGLHGDLSGVAAGLADLSGVADTSGIGASMIELGKFGTAEQKYLPWMQATYVMAANRQAIEYLPAGADIDALTYDQLIAWCKALAEGTGALKCGLPAGPKGLKHRFFQGFLLPSYTG